MANNRKNNNKRKRKQTGTHSPPENPSKMADQSNSNSKHQPVSQSGIVLQQSNQSPLTSNMYSEAHQTLYGPISGYPFTPYQPPAPHTTPAPVLTTGNQQIPSMPWPQTTPLTPLYPELDRFMNDVTNKLKKLDVLDDIHSRLISLESHCLKIDSEVSDIKRQVEEHSANFINIDNGLGEMHGKLKFIEGQNYNLLEENMKLKERMVEQQSRSMRDNLIFKGIQDEYDPREDTEGKVKEFIKSELGVEEEVNFHVVHRLKPRQDWGPRGIVAKFERRKDKNKILNLAKEKLKQKPQFVIHEQFPIEIIERRRQLIPILKDARQKGHEAVLKEDKLFIDRRRYYPRPDHYQQHDTAVSSQPSIPPMNVLTTSTMNYPLHPPPPPPGDAFIPRA